MQFEEIYEYIFNAGNLSESVLLWEMLSFFAVFFRAKQQLVSKSSQKVDFIVKSIDDQSLLEESLP